MESEELLITRIHLKLVRLLFDFNYFLIPQIAITSWTPRGKNLAHGWSRRIYP